MKFNLSYTLSCGDRININFERDNNFLAIKSVYEELIHNIKKEIIYFSLLEGELSDGVELSEDDYEDIMLFEFYGNLTPEILRGILFERYE